MKKYDEMNLWAKFTVVFAIVAVVFTACIWVLHTYINYKLGNEIIIDLTCEIEQLTLQYEELLSINDELESQIDELKGLNDKMVSANTSYLSQIDELENSVAEYAASSWDYQQRRMLLLDIMQENDQEFDEWDAALYLMNVCCKLSNERASSNNRLTDEEYEYALQLLDEKADIIFEGFENGEDLAWLKFKTFSVVETINWHLESSFNSKFQIQEELELEELNKQIYGEKYETIFTRY